MINKTTYFGYTQDEVIQQLLDDAKEDAVSIDDILQNGEWLGLSGEELVAFARKLVFSLLSDGARPVNVLCQDGKYAWKLAEGFSSSVEEATEKIFEQWKESGAPRHDCFIWFYNGSDIVQK